MRAQIKRKTDAIFAAVMAFILAFGLSGLPSTAMADNRVPVGGATVSGVDFMQPDAEGWEVLKVESLGDGELFITVKDSSGRQLGPTQKFTSSNSDERLAEIICLQIPGSQTSQSPSDTDSVSENKMQAKAQSGYEAFGSFGTLKTFSVTVSDAYKGGSSQTWTIYPVYAQTVDNEDNADNPVLIGTRTALTPSEGATPSVDNLNISDTYYKQDKGAAYPTTYYLEGVTFNSAKQAFVATYAEPEEGVNLVSGKIKYVTPDGELITEDQVSGITESGKVADVRQSFEIADENGNTTYYRTISSQKKVLLSYANSTYTVVAVPFTFDGEDKFPVTINYVDKNGNELWSDTVDVYGKGYRYTLPNVFSVKKDNLKQGVAEKLEDGVNVYQLIAVKGGDIVQNEGSNGGAGITTQSADTVQGTMNLEGFTFVNAEDGIGTSVNLTKNLSFDDFVIVNDQRTVTAVYEPQLEDAQVQLRIAMIDGSTGKQIGDEDLVLTVTPTQSATFNPNDYTPDGYVPWAGNASPIEYSWASLANGEDLRQYVYYVPEGYKNQGPKEITIKYVDVRNPSAALWSQTFTIDPDNTNYLEFVGEPTFTQDGSTYIRLDGQDSGIRHAYFSPNDTYTIWYRNSNDTINANNVVSRVQIIDTVVPGTGGGITAAPALTDDAAAGDPNVEAGIGAGEGTVLINDDNNPLSNLNGQDTTTERTIAENENPLAANNLASNPLAIAGIVAGVIAVVATAAYVILRRRKNANDKQNA